MNAEKYLERIENKRLNGTPLYSRTEMIDFAEKYAKQLTIPVVSKSVVCGNCDGYGYTVDENGRRKEHCNECE